MRGTRTTAVLGCLIAAGLIFWTGTANAADRIVADDACCTFAPGPYGQSLGEIPTFDNPVTADAPHNVAANDPGPDGFPLFYSDTIMPGGTSPVEGAQYLPAGTYGFFCTLHGDGMSGQLVVDGNAGQARPRPAVRLAVPRQKLRQVRRSGRIKIRVNATAPGNDIALTINRGARPIAAVPKLNFPAARNRVLNVKLTKAGRKAMRKGKRVNVVVRGTVPFGAPARGSRVLR